MNTWKVEATDKSGQVLCSWHPTKEEAKRSAAAIRGRYPFGNRVKVVPVPATT